MRILLYFIVALIAFGVGSFFAYKFYWKHEGTSETVQIKEIETPASTESGKDFAASNSNSTLQSDPSDSVAEKPKITCRDKNLLPIWNELIKTSSYREREKDFSHDADCSEMLEVKMIDLNEDGQKEFVLWGQPRNLCGGTSNCDLWIYEKKIERFVLLFESNGFNDGEEKWFEVNNRKVNKYRNILIKGHASGFETTEHYYEFDGKKYQERKCLFISYHPDPKGTVMTCEEAWKW